MTHEKHANDEHTDGPEYDRSLLPAGDIPVYADPEDSDAGPLDEED